jgi:hypothetical protein
MSGSDTQTKPDLRGNRGVEQQLELIDAALARARFLVLELDTACNERGMLLITPGLSRLNQTLVQAQRLNVDVANML